MISSGERNELQLTTNTRPTSAMLDPDFSDKSYQAQIWRWKLAADQDCVFFCQSGIIYNMVA